MARTLTEIYDAIIAEKESQAELIALLPDPDSAQQLLADLQTTSRVARWRMMLWVVAVAVWVHEKLWDIFKAEVDAVAAASAIGTLRWYVTKMKAWQYGYTLELVDGVYTYVDDVPAARIVTRCAVVDQSGIVIIKVAKEVAGVVVPLDAPEQLALTTYINLVKMAGTVTNLVSLDSDLLRITATVYYNPLVLHPDGSLILQPTVFPVEDAILAYLASLPFNAAITRTKLVDAMQSAAGVVDPVLVNAEARYGLVPFASFPIYHIPVAGHAVIDPATPLSSTITYVPNVV